MKNEAISYVSQRDGSRYCVYLFDIVPYHLISCELLAASGKELCR
jgi:hypothetical protein